MKQRQEQIKVGLPKPIKEAFVKYADEQGISTSELGKIVIKIWLHQNRLI